MFKKTLIAMALPLILSTTACAKDIKLDTDTQKESYAMGVMFAEQISNSLKSGGVDFDTTTLVSAISDVISEKDAKMTQEEIQAVLTAQGKRLQAAAAAKAESAKKDGDDFIAEYAKKDGAKKTDSGIYYTVETEGKGDKPTAESTVEVHYTGKLRDGTVFDSSVKRGTPAEFPVAGVIKGWQEIIPMMPVGSKWEVAIPSDLAYGERGAGADIGPNEPLVFEIELLSIK